MKCIKKLVALTLAAVLALAMLTACGGTSETPIVETSKETKMKVLSGLNKTRAELEKPDLEENDQLDLLAARYMAALKKCNANWNDATLKTTKEKLLDEAYTLEINGAKVTYRQVKTLYIKENDHPITTGKAFELDKVDADYVGIAVDNIGDNCYTIVWFVKTAD